MSTLTAEGGQDGCGGTSWWWGFADPRGYSAGLVLCARQVHGNLALHPQQGSREVWNTDASDTCDWRSQRGRAWPPVVGVSAALFICNAQRSILASVEECGKVLEKEHTPVALDARAALAFAATARGEEAPAGQRTLLSFWLMAASLQAYVAGTRCRAAV